MSKGKISPEFLQKLREATNITEIIGEHVTLRKSGANHSGLCPFHSERTPSFSVNEQKQLYHCYGCKKGGDLFRFVMEIHGISFPEAVEELAERARIPLPSGWVGLSEEEANNPELAAKRNAQREKLELSYRMSRFAASFFHQSLEREKQIADYFRARAVDGDLARLFYVGAAPAGWDALSNHLAAKKAPFNIAAELGLVRPSPKNIGSGYFDLFRNRAIFPILNLRGKVAGFGGRAMGPEETPKYLNSPESQIFQKSKLLFGLYQSQKYVREKNEIIIVEGYFDTLALFAAGFTNVAATCGTALSSEHLQILKRISSRIILLFDGDKAGVAATARAMETALAHGLILHGAVMPAGLDPDEILFDQETGAPLSGGQDKMREILSAARPILDDQIDEQVRSSRENPEAKSQAIKQIAVWLKAYTDPIGRELRAETASKILGVSKQLFDRALGLGSSEYRTRQAVETKMNLSSRTQKAPTKPMSKNDRLLLTAILRWDLFGPLFEQMKIKMPPEMTFAELFLHQESGEFIASLAKIEGGLNAVSANLGQFLSQNLDPQVRSILTEASVSDPQISEADLKLALSRSIGRAWARFSQQIKKALAEAELSKDAGLQAKLMKEYLDVQRKMKEFNSFYDEA